MKPVNINNIVGVDSTSVDGKSMTIYDSTINGDDFDYDVLESNGWEVLGGGFETDIVSGEYIWYRGDPDIYYTVLTSTNTFDPNYIYRKNQYGQYGWFRFISISNSTSYYGMKNAFLSDTKHFNSIKRGYSLDLTQATNGDIILNRVGNNSKNWKVASHNGGIIDIEIYRNPDTKNWEVYKNGNKTGTYQDDDPVNVPNPSYFTIRWDDSSMYLDKYIREVEY